MTPRDCNAGSAETTEGHRDSRSGWRAALIVLLVAAPVVARGQPAPSSLGSQVTITGKNEATVRIPPQGGTADVLVRFSTNVMLTFPTFLSSHVVLSSSDWDFLSHPGSTDAFVRPITRSAAPTTLALATNDGVIKVNILLRVVPEDVDSLILVRFQGFTAEEVCAAPIAVDVANVHAVSRRVRHHDPRKRAAIE